MVNFFDKGTKIIQWRQDRLFNNDAGTIPYTTQKHNQKTKTTSIHIPHIIKLTQKLCDNGLCKDFLDTTLKTQVKGLPWWCGG